jgi:hypothetical protein
MDPRNGGITSLTKSVAIVKEQIKTLKAFPFCFVPNISTTLCVLTVKHGKNEKRELVEEGLCSSIRYGDNVECTVHVFDKAR